MPREWRGFEMVAPDAPLRAARRDVPVPGAGQALVEVAGCGICHTDLGFLDHGVRTRHALPLVLGHEISGVVREAPGHPGLVDTSVVVPAVLPCGTCDDCRAGRPMICRAQIMPGNDVDGGFATHVVVPVRGLCPVPVADPDAELRPGLTLRHLAVIADAVSTPYQALRRAEVRPGDLVVVIGLGGVGGYAAQLARALGARVVGLDVDPRKLADAPGVDLAVDPRAYDGRGLRDHLRSWARAQGVSASRWTLLECSGTAAGQRTAWGLLGSGSTLCVVGYTLDEIPVRLSNLMALDARAIGNWGCDPALYPEILRLVLDGRIDVASHTELRPLDTVDAALDDVRAHRVTRRIVLVP